MPFPATQSGGLEGILPGVAALPLRGVSLPTAARFIAVDTGSSRSGGWWRGGEATVGVVPDVALADAEVVQLAAHADHRTWSYLKDKWGQLKSSYTAP
eukprot:COSAG03_NODE_13584_length_496_cov_7.105793_1_plen_98_part_00